MGHFSKILQLAEYERARREEAGRGRDTTDVAGTAPPAPRGRLVPPATAESPKSLDGVEGHLVSLLSPASGRAEPYRVVRHLLEQLHRTAQLSVVAVSSAVIAEGKTTTAINLAGALAQASDARVLLVDADLRSSSVAHYLALGRGGRRGLVDAILDPGLGLDDVVSPRPPFNLDVLPAGTLRPDPYEVLKSPRLGELLEEARRRYDYVILDTAPLVAVPDSRLLGKWVDGFLVVVAAHRTPRKLIAETLDLMEPAKLIALLFNGDDELPPGYTYPTSVNGSSRRSKHV
jgi:capsular exopolysaccharide synthesis family protein